MNNERQNKVQTNLANLLIQEHLSLLESLSKYSYKDIRPELLSKIINKIDEPEEKVRYYWVQKLIHEYGYDSRQIDINVPAGVGRNRSNVYADIVVYRDVERTEPFVVGEVKAMTERYTDEEQGAGYARNIGAEYHFWSNKSTNKYWKTSHFPNKSSPVGNIPLWLSKKPIIERVKNTEILPPFKDVKEFKNVISTLHNLIYDEGHDPAYAFDELTKLLFLKLYDERETPRFYEFMALANETQNETVERIQKLFDKAVKDTRYHDVFLTRYNRVTETRLDLKSRTIYLIVQELQGYSLVNTIETIMGVDIKGEAYEEMVGGTFRGELGQYFTPREIVDFMVKMLEPSKTDKILDPACGSGGFLIMCIRQVKDRIIEDHPNLDDTEIGAQIKYFCEHNIFGLDINPRMARVAKMNMIMHGDGHSGIFNVNGLMLEDADPEDARKNINNNSFDLIFSNPPFAKFETNQEILSHFEVGRNDAGNIRGVNKALVFVERIVKLLSDNGRAAMVLPRSIFENNSYSFRKLREIILKNCEITAIIGLPKTAFHHTDTGILGDLLFIKKVKNPREEYDVFLSWANNVGYDTIGHIIEDNDFPSILKAFKDKDKKFQVSISKLKENDNWNPWYYHPQAKNLRAKVELKTNVVPLTDLVSVYDVRISRKLLSQNPNQVLQYLEVRDFDPTTGSYKPKDKKPKNLPSRATYRLNGEELILLPNAKNSLESKRRIIKINGDTNGFILTNRFLPLRPKVNPQFLLLMLNTDFVRDQIIQKCTGAGAPDLNSAKLKEVMIPVPDVSDLSKIDSFMEEIEDKLARKAELEKKAKELDGEINSRLAILEKKE